MSNYARGDESIGNGGIIGEEGELDMNRQMQIESYRRRFEEALVRIEDKDDV